VQSLELSIQLLIGLRLRNRLTLAHSLSLDDGAAPADGPRLAARGWVGVCLELALLELLHDLLRCCHPRASWHSSCGAASSTPQLGELLPLPITQQLI
jgi:hypothetical protein